jgi:GNAT superfamily N-acetyltransferase
MDGGVAIRRARPDDIEMLAAVHLRSALHAYGGIFPADAPPPELDQLVDGWQRALRDPGAVPFTAEADGAVVGGVIASSVSSAGTGTGNLRHLYVDPDHWGRGIGRVLHDRVVAWCRDAGLDTIDLWVLEGQRAGSSHVRAVGLEAL